MRLRMTAVASGGTKLLPDPHSSVLRTQGRRLLSDSARRRQDDCQDRAAQTQRIAIARALIANARILIFDEATRALDYGSERIVQQSRAQIAAGRTVFIIAHRLSTLRIANRIVTIERGRLIEDGTHEELIKRGGRPTGYRASTNPAKMRPRAQSKRDARQIALISSFYSGAPDPM